MSKVIRRGIGTGVALLLIGLLLAPAAFGQDSGEDKKVIYTLGSDNDVDSMNPFIGVEAPAYFMYGLNYDSLIGYSQEDLSPVPRLAESWETSEDGKAWTFNIRQGMKWSDGEDLDANDVAYTYQRVLDEKQGCCIDYISLIDNIEVPDDYTVVMTTRKPTTQLLQGFPYILPEHVWSKISEKEAKTFENYPDPVTSGPFHLSEWQKGQFFTMEANPDYYAGAPKIDAITYRVFNNEDAAVQALKAGELDFIDGLSANAFTTLQNQEGIGTHEANIPSFDEIGMNTGADDVIPDSDGHPALKDPIVRQAMSHAVDKEVVADRVLRGYGTVGETIVPPFSAAYHYEPPEEDVYEFDLDLANQMLEDAGYVDTDDDGVREMPGGGRPLEFRYYTRSEDNGTSKTAQFVSSWFEDIGIATNVEALTDTKLTNVIFEGNYDIFHWGWFPDPDPDFILSIFTCSQRPPGGIWSDSFYCDEEYDQMYAEQKTVADAEERATIVKEMQKQIYEAAPYIVLYYDANLQAYSTNWTGFKTQPAGDGDLLSGYGTYTFLSLEQKSASASNSGTARGIPAGLWIAIVVGLVAIALVVMFVRRRVGEEDRA
ncbi:MAG: ABC transporter substrate-binding protein [Actinobacteria bacterium]|nr:ABC transporter substrate-binding protein [Actinomycetota bacterium]